MLDNSLLIGIIIALITSIITMGGYWLLFAKDLVNRSEVMQMISSNMLTKEDILQITESRNAVIENEIQHLKAITEELRQNTIAINSLDKRLAIFEQRISSLEND